MLYRALWQLLRIYSCPNAINPIANSTQMHEDSVTLNVNCHEQTTPPLLLTDVTVSGIWYVHLGINYADQ